MLSKTTVVDVPVEEQVSRQARLAHFRFGEVVWLLRTVMSEGKPEDGISARQWHELQEDIESSGLITPRQQEMLEELRQEFEEFEEDSEEEEDEEGDFEEEFAEDLEEESEEELESCRKEELAKGSKG